MNALKKISEEKANKPYYGFAKLAKGHHKIESFRFVKNKFAKKSEKEAKTILVELKNQVIFLPQHFSVKLNQADILELNSSAESIYLYFGGKQESSKYVNKSKYFKYACIVIEKSNLLIFFLN